MLGIGHIQPGVAPVGQRASVAPPAAVASPSFRPDGEVRMSLMERIFVGRALRSYRRQERAAANALANMQRASAALQMRLGSPGIEVAADTRTRPWKWLVRSR